MCIFIQDSFLSSSEKFEKIKYCIIFERRMLRRFGLNMMDFSEAAAIYRMIYRIHSNKRDWNMHVIGTDARLCNIQFAKKVT